MRIAVSRALAPLLLLAAAAFAAPESLPDWDEVASVETVEVVTHDEDGDLRETTVWLLVLDGQGYVRTGGTSWGDNVVRDPLIVLRIGEREHPLRVEMVEDDELRARIETAFREKYGFEDAVMEVFRGSRPKIMHLLPRTALEGDPHD